MQIRSYAFPVGGWYGGSLTSGYFFEAYYFE